MDISTSCMNSKRPHPKKDDSEETDFNGFPTDSDTSSTKKPRHSPKVNLRDNHMEMDDDE